jgi:hypothetical protein
MRPKHWNIPTWHVTPLHDDKAHGETREAEPIKNAPTEKERMAEE